MVPARRIADEILDQIHVLTGEEAEAPAAFRTAEDG
jgi:hypothetical protein